VLGGSEFFFKINDFVYLSQEPMVNCCEIEDFFEVKRARRAAA
jgi:hypothetical protein